MGKDLAQTQHTFYFCDGGSCQKAGADSVSRDVRAYLRNNDLWDKTHTIKTRCNGRCEDAPTCIVQPGNYWYKKLDGQKGIELAKSHINTDQPIKEHLLYKDEWENMHTEDERPKIKTSPFKSVQDDELGACHLAAGFSSDQYLYPLFLFLRENAPDAILTLENNTALSFSEITKIEYTHKFALEISTSSAKHQLIIAAVPKAETLLQQLKISKTEYFILDTQETGVRFKNKFGNKIAQITFRNVSSKAWEYCLKIQLQQKTPILS